VADNHNYYVAESVDASVKEFVLAHNAGDCGAMAEGRRIHKEMEYPEGAQKEYNIPGYGRADAVDLDNKIIYELKPGNINGLKNGLKQLDRYANGLAKLTETEVDEWIKILLLYFKKSAN
jgi:hypothetical protein